MAKRQTGGRNEDVTGYFQKSAEVIVGRTQGVQSPRKDAEKKTNSEGLNVRITPDTTGGRRQWKFIERNKTAEPR